MTDRAPRIQEAHLPSYLGSAWGQAPHAACFLADTGTILTQLTFAHHPDGLAKLDTPRRQFGVSLHDCWVGLETAHTLRIDCLWSRGSTPMFVIPPHAVTRARQRYRQTGAHTDQYDACVIADMLRTDQARLQPWCPDSALTQWIRTQVSLLLHRAQEITRASNRWRAVLARYYPAAREVFHDPASQIALQFVPAFPTPAAAAQLSRAGFAAFVRARQYRPSERVLTAAYARLQHPQPATTAATVAAYADEAVLLADLLLPLVQQNRTQLQAVQRLFQQHPDAPSFASLPGAGAFLAPALLATFGDQRRACQRQRMCTV